MYYVHIPIQEWGWLEILTNLISNQNFREPNLLDYVLVWRLNKP